jgi:prefoldin subunit 5
MVVTFVGAVGSGLFVEGDIGAVAVVTAIIGFLIAVESAFDEPADND